MWNLSFYNCFGDLILGLADKSKTLFGFLFFPKSDMIFERLKEVCFKIWQLLIDQEVVELRHIIFCIIVLIVGPSDRHHKEFHIVELLFS